MSTAGIIDREEQRITTEDGWISTRAPRLAHGPTRAALRFLAETPEGNKYSPAGQQIIPTN